jgi:hypothetical protein
MKKIVLIALSALSITACRKGDEPKVDAFSAKINGSIWKANEITRSLINEHLQIEGQSGNKTIKLTVPSYSGEGKYPLNTAEVQCKLEEDNKEFNATSGAIVIVKDDASLIKGTFYFDGTANGSQRKIEEGTFKLYK